jgi:CubicO group peptidase (beta-lactamase class C family)
MTTPDQIDALFTEWDRESTPGCALAIVRDGAIVDARGYGRASLEHHSPIAPATIFHVASVSKQFTAFAIALLAHEGALALDDDIRRTLPDLPDFGAAITLRHLIHHTSGLRDQWELLQLAGWRWDDLMTTADILDLVRHQRALNFAPGAEFAYCNTGYTLMAEIVARVSGMSFRAFCARRIFEPLGMRATHFHDDHTEVVPGRAHSYYPGDGGIWHHAVLNYATVGATSLFTTVEDLARWDRNFETCEVGGAAVLAQMLEPGVLNDGTVLPYAFGIVARTHNGRRVIEHSGGDAGFRAHVARFPDQRLSVIVLGNASTLNPMERAHQIADIMLGASAVSSPTAPAESVTLGEATLAGFAGLYYSATTSETRAVSLRDGRLVLGRGHEAALRPVAADTFQIEGNREIQLRFVRPSGDGPPELHVVSGVLPPVVYLAVTQAAPSAEELAAYAGRYRSDELDVIYTVVIEAGKLVIQRRKHAPTTLEPAHADAFNGTADVHFTRDAAGQIDGFLLTTGRVRNLRFARAELE